MTAGWLILPEDEFRAGRDNCAGDYGWNLRFVTGRPRLENGVYPDVLYPIYGCSKMTNHWIAAHFQSHVYFVENSPTVEPLNPLDFIFSWGWWKSPRHHYAGEEVRGQAGSFQGSSCAVVAAGWTGGREKGTNSSKFVGTSANQSFSGAKQVAIGQNPGTPGEPQVIAGKWMFIPLKMYL